VGSSTIAYGARATPITAADLIAKHYIASLYAGLSQGESLKLAKLEALSEDPLSMEYGLKTVLSFNLFGSPWQTLTRLNTSPILNTTVQSIPTRPAGSVLNRIRGNLQAPPPTKSNAINKIRDEYRARLPPRNRQFMIETDEILSKLREFQDYSKLILTDITTFPNNLIHNIFTIKKYMINDIDNVTKLLIKYKIIEEN
jgi:hypothetical protein